MRLPLLQPELRSQRFDCHACTNCCRELVVHLTPSDREKIDRQAWAAKLGAPAYVRLGREHVLNHRPGGGCVFLRNDGKCRIHADFGAAEKPLACQLFPFTLEREAAAIRAGLRFDCPSVARNLGATLASQAGAIEVLADRAVEEVPALALGRPAATLLKPGHELQEAELEAIVARLDAWLRDTNRPLHQRLLGLCSFRETLDAARVGALRGERFGELIGLLIEELPHAVAELASAPTKPPTDRQLRLLRQSVFAHAEHIGLEQARSSVWSGLRYRLDQLRRSRSLAGGEGTVPPLRPGMPTVTFAELDRVQPASPEREIDDLLTRYLRARVLTRGAFGPAYYGWTLVDGLSALVLAVCAAGWLARFFAAAGGRSAIGQEDAVAAIGMVDRAAGRARELGRASARLRVRYLREDQGLVRLLRAYPLFAAS